MDCSQAICYRSPQPHIISIDFPGRTHGRTVIDVPNSSPIVAIDIERAFLVQRVTDISFDDNTGMLASVHVTKKSEALAAAKLPLEIAKAVFDTSLLKLRVDYASQEDSFVKNEMALAEDKVKLGQIRSGNLQGDVAPGPATLLTVSNAPTIITAAKASEPAVPGAPGSHQPGDTQPPTPTIPATPGKTGT